jgi:hypothetical protein
MRICTRVCLAKCPTCRHEQQPGGSQHALPVCVPCIQGYLACTLLTSILSASLSTSLVMAALVIVLTGLRLAVSML